jgi:hypothetical protein
MITRCRIPLKARPYGLLVGAFLVEVGRVEKVDSAVGGPVQEPGVVGVVVAQRHAAEAHFADPQVGCSQLVVLHGVVGIAMTKVWNTRCRRILRGQNPIP